MALSKNLSTNQRWFWQVMLGIFLVSVVLRFWGLSRFNTLVFDEVYYAIFSNDYLIRKPFFNAHPPLSQYLIAIGIWLGNQMPFGRDAVNGLAGSQLSTFSYRWLNALTGSFIPLVVAAIAYQLNHRRSYAAIAALFAAADGLFLVESRYALNNIYLVIFGLLGQLFLLLALANQGRRRWGWLLSAGVFFGFSAAIKWNGLWFLFGAYLVWVAAWVMRLVRQRTLTDTADKSRQAPHPQTNLLTPLQNLTQLNLLHILINLGIVPVLVYGVSWIPHILLNPKHPQLNPKPGFWEMQWEILTYHQKVGGNDVHPYCSRWYTWPLMSRPVAYFYATARDTTEQVPAFPPLPAGVGNVIYDVHAMGNPILWWFSTLAILLLALLLAQRLLTESGFGKTTPTASTWLVLYLVLNYAANLLPWVRVTRCTFLYHYMGSSVFALLGLAWIVDRWMHHEQSRFRIIGIAVICLIILAFVHWLPIFLGLPLSVEGYNMRMLNVSFKWLPSWLNELLPHWI